MAMRVMQNKLKPLVRELGRNILPMAAGPVLRLMQEIHWDQGTVDELVRQIRQEKVIPQVYRNACLLNEQQGSAILHSLVDSLRDEYERRSGFSRDIVPLIRTEITHILEQADIDFLFIKGSSLEAYPYGYLRQMNDFDLILENWNGFLLAVRALAAQGYSLAATETEAPWMTRLTCSGSMDAQLVGHITLIRYEYNRRIYLDVHCAPFQVGPTGMLMCDLWERLDAQGTTIPTPEDKLLILVAHAVNHGYFLIKDLNDVYAVLHKHKDTFDWHYFCRCIRQSNLSYAANYVLHRVKREYSHECVPRWVLNATERIEERIQALVIVATTDSVKKGPWAEKLIYPFHTLAFERGRYGLPMAVRSAAQYLWWTFRLSILQANMIGPIGDHPAVRSLLHSSKSNLFPAPRRGQQLVIVPLEAICDEISREQIDACTRMTSATWGKLLVQGKSLIEFTAAGPLAVFLRMGRAEVLSTPIGLFVPTEDAVFTEPEVNSLEKLVEALLAICTTIPKGPGIALE